MRPLFAGASFVVALVTGAIAAGWGYVKAVGTEWDYCSGGECHSAWYFVAVLATVSVASATAGFVILRRDRDSTHSRKSG